MNENTIRIWRNTDGSATLNHVEQLTISFFSASLRLCASYFQRR